MEPEGSFACSQEPENGPYPERKNYSKYRRTLF
jgi:hypothetical protein